MQSAMQQELTTSAKQKAKKYLALFEGINAASFILISGQVMVLFALRLGADNFFIGMVSSFQYLSFVFMLIGRAMVGKMGLRRMMRFFWTLRYFMVVPVLFAPLLSLMGYGSAGLAVIAFALLGFNVARGIAIIGFNPILGMVTDKKSMGDYLSRLQIIYHGASLVCAVIIALAIGKDAPLWRYVIFIATGIGLGLWGSSLIRHFPDPVLEDDRKAGFIAGLRAASARSDFRRFILHFFLLSTITGMAVPFIIVYAREVYRQSDQALMVLTVVGGLGAVVMGLASRLLMDRIGAKPLYLLYTLLFAIALTPLVVAPDMRGGSLFLLLALVFFLYHLGQMGGQVASRNYFYAITEKRDHLNLGIIYQLMMGVGNALGAIGGGWFLQLLVEHSSLAAADGYRLYFGLLLFLCLLMIGTALFIRDAGRYSVGNALSIIFSPRDLRAVVLLDKLDRSSDEQQQMRFLSDIAEVGSSVALDDVLSKIKSPRFYVRARALRALENAPLEPRIVEVLIQEVKKRTYTTAHIAARILGRRQIVEAKDALIHALRSRDYLLKANAMIALARIGGEGMHSIIEDTLVRSSNPMVIMHGAVALQLLGDVNSLPVMAELLKTKDPPAFLRDEIILSMAALLSMERWFYPLYTIFQEDKKRGVEELVDRFSTSLDGETQDSFPDLKKACTMVLKNPAHFASALIPVFQRLPLSGWVSADVLIGIASDEELLRFERLRFFLAAFSVRTLVRQKKHQKARRKAKKSGRHTYRRSDDPIDL